MAEQTQTLDFDTEAGGAYAPELYRVGEVARAIRGFGSVSDDAIRSFREQGFLAVEGAFAAEVVDGARAALLELIDGRRAGFKGLSFEKWARDKISAMSLDEKQDAVRKLMWFVAYDVRLKAMASDPALLELVRKLLGAEPVLFQEMALLKPPHGGREKPWHQDHAYFDLSLDTPVVGVWIALDEAGIDNGCMHVIAGGHLGGPMNHFRRRDWQICDTELLGRSCTAVPLEPGGCLIFSGLLPHGTPINSSSKRRRALQFHYAPVGAVKVPQEARLAVFGGEGEGASC